LDDFRLHLKAASVAQGVDKLLGSKHAAAQRQVIGYLDAMKSRGLSPATINRRLSTLRSLGKQARILGLVPWLLEAANVKAEVTRETKGLSRDQLLKILAHLASQPTSRDRLRDLAIIRLTYDLGLRRGEISELNLADAGKEGLRVHRNGETGENVLALPPETMAALDRWIEARGPTAGALFINFDSVHPTKTGARLTGGGIYETMRRLESEAGAAGPSRGHGIRPAAITEGPSAPTMVTIYDVAKEAGVSPKTAARILGGEDAKPRNRQQVMSAAAKLGYVRNQQAANFRSGKSGLLGLVVPDIKNPYYPVLFQAVHDCAIALGYQILLSSTFGRKTEEVHALRMFEANRVEGILLNAPESESDADCDSVLQRFISRGVPIIVAGRPVRSLAADQIVLKNQAGIERGVGYLFKLNRRRIAFISGNRNAVASLERLAGYESAFKIQNLPVDQDLVSYGDFTAESGYDQTLALLRRSAPPDAIVAANDLLAIGALRACHDSRCRVPQDVAVLGFDDIPLAQYCSPALTTLRQPTERIARDCVTLLVERINNRDISPPRNLTYEPELLIRESA